MKYYIMDTRQVVGNCVLWWAPKGQGYVCDLNEAGLFEKGHSSRDTDVEVPEDIAKACAVTHVRVESLRHEMDKAGLNWMNRRRR